MVDLLATNAVLSTRSGLSTHGDQDLSNLFQFPGRFIDGTVGLVPLDFWKRLPGTDRNHCIPHRAALASLVETGDPPSATNDPPTIPRTALDNIIDRKLHWTSKTSSSCHPRPQGPDSFGVSPGVTLTKNFRVLEAPGISTLRMNPSLLSEVFSLNDPVTSEGDYMNSHVTGFGTDEDDNSQRVGGLVSMPDTNGVRYHAQHPLMQDLQ
ncbi:hypothetical protein CBS147339_4307 [Penicillium roqueforti]|nr:hypothetical protein CBS147339_4307 [Penicillium roqueforti]KAI3094083.1 hypothetical protein CBS147338_6794 [Penicillium roqueforti]KAI3185204.1 hypothetical protein DTO032C6_5580 [Penicillium roqueforti]